MLRRLLRWSIYLALAGAAVVGAAVLYYGRDLPPLEGIHEIKRRPQVVINDVQTLLIEDGVKPN